MASGMVSRVSNLFKPGQRRADQSTYQPVPPSGSVSPGGSGGEEMSKARLARLTDRGLRRISTLKFWGMDGMLLWFAKSTYDTFLIYSCICGIVILMKINGVSLCQDVLDLPVGYRPLLMGTLQFLAAFLVGVGLTDAVVRYKNAMASLTDLSDSVENLRMVLLSSTEDPKFRIAIQVHITWMIVILRKKIAFFTEDFDQTIASLIHPCFHDSLLFVPEVLWSVDRSQAEFCFNSFLINAKLMDKEGMVKKANESMNSHWKCLASLFMVRSPTTRHVLGKACVQLFLSAIPIFNEDIVTLVALPFVSCVLVALLRLSAELADPWGDEFHDLPMSDVMFYLSVPQWFGEDESQAEETIVWLNKGMSENDWTWRGNSPIPREKRRGSSKGEVINFEDYRTIQQVMGYDSFQKFIGTKAKDMHEAEARGRRMPKYLRWR